MFNLIMAVLCTTAIFLAFRSFKLFNINTLQAVVINYWVCIITGGISLNKFGEMYQTFGKTTWFIWAVVLGFMFVGTFYLTAITTQKAGVSVATLASKMSLLIPVVFGILILGTESKTFDIWNYLGIILSLFSIVLTSLKDKKRNDNLSIASNKYLMLILAFAVFLLSGIIDTSLSYVNFRFFNGEDGSIFLMFTFGFAAIVGTSFLLFQILNNKTKIERKSVIGGLYLGIPNFFSLFFLLRALSDFSHDTAFLFPVFNILIIVVSSIFAIILFREKLSRLNLLGILMAILALLLIAHQELFKDFL